MKPRKNVLKDANEIFAINEFMAGPMNNYFEELELT